MKRQKKEESSSERLATNDEDVMDLYEKVSKYYDIWTDGFEEDIDFYKRLAERNGGPIMVGMCGTGRVLLPLAKEGYEIAGFDKSYAMLDQLTAKVDLLDEELQENIRLGHGDIRNVQCSKKYRLVIIPFNSFLHLLETEEQEEALRNLADHLRADGQLVLSVFNPRLDRPENIMRHRGTRVTKHGEIISKFESQTFDHSKQRTTAHLFLDISRQDRELRRVTAVMTLRYMFEREVLELLARCGLTVVETYGDYQFSPLRKNSDIMVFVARKSK